MLDESDKNLSPTYTPIDRKLGRYEMSMGSHNKFWECLYHSGKGYSAKFLVRWGRIGTKKPQHMYKDYSVIKDIEKKINKGYSLVPGSYKTEVEATKALLASEINEVIEEKKLKELPTLSRKRKIM